MKKRMENLVELCIRGLEDFMELVIGNIGIVYYPRGACGGFYLSNKTKNYDESGNKKNKKGIVADYLPWLLIAIAILAILMITIFLLKSRGISLIEQIKDLFKLG